MSENEALPGSGEQPRVEETKPEVKAPRNDAEAAVVETTEKPEGDKPEGDDKPKRNRTGEYIAKQKARIKALEAELAKVQPAQQKAEDPKPEPTLEQHNYDQAAFDKARTDHLVQQALQTERAKFQQQELERNRQSLAERYTARVADFAAQQPDFQAAVGSIPPGMFNDSVQFAIMAQENGPEIAYQLATNDDLAWELALTPPHLAAAAVARIASRLSATPQVPQPQTQPISTKPVSRAPAPVQTVSGKSPTETPDEKLTDDQWMERRRARRAAERKRAS